MQNTHPQITLEEFQADRHGKTFADILNDPNIPFDKVLQFFNDPARQQRMEDSEIHQDRAPLAGVVRELESLPAVRDVLGSLQRRRSARLRQATGVLVRMIMERRGWRRTGRKGSLGVRGSPDSRTPYHNTGGLALWFIRAERYRRDGGMPYRSVREQAKEIEAGASVDASVAHSNGDQPSAPSAPSADGKGQGGHR